MLHPLGLGIDYGSVPRCRMTSTFETRTRSLRYQLRSRGIYTEERTPINSSEILSKLPQTQDDSPIHHTGDTKQPVQAVPLGNTLHAPCSLKSVNRSPSPPLFSPTPASSLAHVPMILPRTSHFPFQLAPLRTKPLPVTIAQNCSAPPFQ